MSRKYVQRLGLVACECPGVSCRRQQHLCEFTHLRLYVLVFSKIDQSNKSVCECMFVDTSLATGWQPAQSVAHLKPRRAQLRQKMDSWMISFLALCSSGEKDK